MQLQDKVAIITGAGSGIGKSSALLFAREGVKVVCADRNAATSHAVAALIEAEGGTSISVEADVSRSNDVRRLMDTTAGTYGGLDILFNNAGVGNGKLLADLPEDEWDRVIDTNLKGPYLCAKYAIPLLKARGGGVIINMSSVLGFTALIQSSVYCASKAAIRALTQALALELARENIRVNALAPGSIDTPMLWEDLTEAEIAAARREMTEAQPVGYLGTPDQIARAALWLATNEVDFMTGVTLPIDGGVLARFSGWLPSRWNI